MLIFFSFIRLSARAVEWQCSCFATILLHHAPSKMMSVLVPFVMFGVIAN